jgi:DNA-binding PadR family transcriptional regulator
MRSPLAWPLLGLVIEQPSYGYELVQRFRRVYGETLALADSKRIYRLLDMLHTHSLIDETLPSAEEPPARNRMPKPHYRATEVGRRAYAEWLLIQMEEERHRRRLFVRQLAMLEPQAALQVMDRYEEECLTEADGAAPPQRQRDVVADRLAKQEEQLSLEARLSWIGYARRQLAPLLAERPGEAAGQ